MNNILQEADKLTSGDRNIDYGHPLDDFTKVVEMAKSLGLVQESYTVRNHCIYMVLVKLSRELNKPKRDNVVDAAGYLRTLEMCDEEIERRLSPENEAIRPEKEAVEVWHNPNYKKADGWTNMKDMTLTKFDGNRKFKLKSGLEIIASYDEYIGGCWGATHYRAVES